MKRLFALVILAALPLAAVATAQSTRSERVRVGLGYLPDVQFAPFYLAAEAGIYARFGLEVTFQHGFASELYPLLAQGRLDAVVADAEDVIALRGRDPAAAPFRYVMALYQEVPNVLFAPASAGIADPSDLRGRTIGVPGLFGTSYTSLQALLRAAGLSEDDVTVVQIGFTQAEAVLAGRVDAAMGFVNNEPLLLAAQGLDLSVIPAGPANPSPGVGVIASDATLERAELTRRFLAATQEAVAATLADPERAFDAARAYVTNLQDDRLAVLEATLPLYQSDTTRERGLGFTDPERWRESLALLEAIGRVVTDLPPEAFYSNAFLTPGVQVPDSVQVPETP